MAKINKVVLNSIPKFAIKRFEYKPNQIHNPGLCEVVVTDDSSGIYTQPSCTDKESYRVTLASMRGMIQKLGSPNVGHYSLQDGKYNPDFDFSYLNRPDLTIVDITSYINTLRDNLVKFDDETKQKIQEELDKADALLKEKEKERTSDSDSSSASSE